MSAEMSLRKCLRELGMEERGVEWSVARMLELEGLLLQWSERLGLTGFEETEVRTERYFLEALAAYRHVPLEGRIMDIGSGGGSPALPLAIVTPASHWTLVESRRKKAWFLEEAVRVLGLGNVEVENRRFETRADGRWRGVTCRGVRVDAKLLSGIDNALEPEGRFFWFSGRQQLEVGRDALDAEVWACEGPFALDGGRGPGSSLLVCQKIGAPGV